MFYNPGMSFSRTWAILSFEIQSRKITWKRVYYEICEAGHRSRFDALDRVLRAGALGFPEGWDREGGGRGVQDGGHVYTRGRFMSMYGKTTTVL